MAESPVPGQRVLDEVEKGLLTVSPAKTEVGIVIIKDNNLPRNRWKLALVEETYPDDDGLVRKVRLKIADRNLDENGRPTGPATSLCRPVQKLILLLSREEYEDRGIPT